MARGTNVILRFSAALLLALFGLTGIIIGAPNILRWADMPAKYVAYYGVSLLAGLALLAFGLLSVRKTWRRPLAFCGLGAAGVLVLNQFLGLKFQAILCFTPT